VTFRAAAEMSAQDRREGIADVPEHRSSAQSVLDNIMTGGTFASVGFSPSAAAPSARARRSRTGRKSRRSSILESSTSASRSAASYAANG